MRLRTKLTAAFLSMVVPFVLVGLITIASNRILARSIRQMQQIARQLEAVSHLQLTVAYLPAAPNDYLSTGDPAEEARYTQAVARVEAAFTELEAIPFLTDDERALLTEARRQVAAMDESARAILALPEPVGDAGGIALMRQLDALAADLTTTTLAPWHGIDTAELAEAQQMAQAAERRTSLWLVLDAMVALLAATLMGAFLARYITRPLHELQVGAETIAGGQFDHRLDIRTGDEIEQLAQTFNQMGARLGDFYAELERRMAELSALNAMATIVSQSLHVDEILERAMDEALRLVGVEAVGMLLLDEEAGELTLVAHRGLSEEFVRAARRLKLGEGLAGRAAQTGEPAVIAHVAEYAGALKPFLEKERIQSAASVPLIGSSGVMGAMSLGTARPDYFDAAGMELLLALGGQIAVGVEKARLYQETQQRAERMAALNEIARTVASSLEIDAIFPAITDTVRRLIPFNRASVALLDDKDEMQTVFALRSEAIESELGQGVRVPFPPVVRAVMASRQAMLRPDLAQSDDPADKMLVQEGIRAGLVAPLISRGQVIGTLNVGHKESNYYTQEHLVMLQSVADQIAPAVENARLYAEARARAAELEAAYKELHEAQEQLIRQEKLAVLGTLAGGVGHELRNPLGVISNAVYYLNMVLSDADETTATAKEYLELIASEVRNAAKIVSDLLDFSRIGPAEREEIAVSELVARVLEKQPPPKKVAVTTRIPSDLPPVFVDPRQMEQVLVNLLTNAYQAMPEGGRLVIKTSEVSGKLPKSWWVALSVSDTGQGIPPENMDKLFEPLFTTKRRGIGLGLATSRNLVEANGGRIEVESEVGKGSTFTVWLPVASDR